jgi:hypothetical protein
VIAVIWVAVASPFGSPRSNDPCDVGFRATVRAVQRIDLTAGSRVDRLIRAANGGVRAGRRVQL